MENLIKIIDKEIIIAIVLPVIVRSILSFGGKVKNSYVFNIPEFRISKNIYYGIMAILLMVSIMIVQYAIYNIAPTIKNIFSIFVTYTLILFFTEIIKTKKKIYKWHAVLSQIILMFILSFAMLLGTLYLTYTVWIEINEINVLFVILIIMILLFAVGVVMSKDLIKTYVIVTSKTYIFVEFENDYKKIANEFKEYTIFDLNFSRKNVSILTRNPNDAKLLFKRIECPKSAIKYYGVGYINNLQEASKGKYNKKRLKVK